MIEIIFNGKALKTTQFKTINDFLINQKNLPENYAVALNRTFIPKTEYKITAIKNGDQIELLIPMQGG